MEAKKLCAMLVTRGLKTLSEDEENIVVDYLESIGIETELDDSPKDLCVKLLEKTMKSELNRQVPISAYANSLLTKTEQEKQEKETKTKLREEEQKRRNIERTLDDKSSLLPGCVPDVNNIITLNVFKLIVNEEVGIDKMIDDTLQYVAQVALNSNLYQKIFLNVSNPVLQITTNKGYKGYVKIGSVHNESEDVIFISPLVGSILNIDKIGYGSVKLCIDIPKIKKVNFTYYGKEEDLNNDLPLLIEKLPQVINAFSYLSLGMVLKTSVNNKEVMVRVDELEDKDNIPIFVGIISPGESDIPFDIVPDK